LCMRIKNICGLTRDRVSILVNHLRVHKKIIETEIN